MPCFPLCLIDHVDDFMVVWLMFRSFPKMYKTIKKNQITYNETKQNTKMNNWKHYPEKSKQRIWTIEEEKKEKKKSPKKRFWEQIEKLMISFQACNLSYYYIFFFNVLFLLSFDLFPWIFRMYGDTM